MKKLITRSVILFAACFFLVKNAEAQVQRSVLRFAPHQLNQAELTLPDQQQIWRGSAVGDLPLQKTGPFLAYSIVWYAADWEAGTDQMLVSYNISGKKNTLTPIEEDGHTEESEFRHVSQLYFLEENATKIRLQFVGQHKVDSIQIHFFDPGLSQPYTASHRSSLIPHPAVERSACTCPQPTIEGRLDWCPDGSCPTDPTPEFVANPTHIIVHHTAGTNTATDWAAVVRSIWDFHVNVNGWDDIGYNFLVDPNGMVYEGRGDGRLGAHFCAQNGGTVGICVMGDFTSIQPTDEAVGSLEDFLAWDCCDKNIDPLGSGFHGASGLTLPFISGHRDGCMTSCPGDMFYPLLPGVRQATQDKILAGCNSDVLAAPTVLAITYVGATKISLSWVDNAVNETGYAIERSDSTDDNFTQIVQLPGNSTSFSDEDVTPGSTYFYRVRAKKDSDYSAYSNVAVAVTSLTATEARLHGGWVQAFPNPTSGLLNLSIDNQWVGQTQLAVYDAMGRLASGPFFEEKNSAQANFKLDLGGLPAGIFMLKLTEGDEAGWIRLVKK